MNENDKPRLLKVHGSLLGLQETRDGNLEVINKEFLSHLFGKESIKVKVKRDKLNRYPEILFNKLLSERRVIREKQKEKIHKIESFSIVATKEIKKEASIFVKSLRLFHDQPVYIVCDEETKEYLEKEGFKNLDFELTATEEELRQIKRSYFKDKFENLKTFHRVECIYKKMECMRKAIKKYGNTLFLDADIIVVDNLQEDFTKKLALSPHYHPEYKSHMTSYCGIFNAGYVFSTDEKFPDLWKELYLNDSSFYEQECMNYFCEYYDIDIIPDSHNVGFWRDKAKSTEKNLKLAFNRAGLKKPKSFHVHILNEIDFKNNHVVKKKNSEMRRLVLNYLYQAGHRELYRYIKNKTNYKNKTAFIHFGKCAGVYVNKYMRNNVLPEAIEMNSWSKNNPLQKNLGRDWTEKELIDIANGTFNEVADHEVQTVHNHHINYTLRAIEEFKKNNWFTFTFLRDPKDIICSLYFYAKKMTKEKSLEKNPLAGEITRLSGQLDPELVSLEEFFAFCLVDLDARRLWVLPDYIDELDYVAEFNDKNFKEFLETYYSYEYVPSARTNTTQNKGYNYYRDSDLISEKTQTKIETDPEYKKYFKYLAEV